MRCDKGAPCRIICTRSFSLQEHAYSEISTNHREEAAVDPTEALFSHYARRAVDKATETWVRALRIVDELCSGLELVPCYKLGRTRLRT